MCSLIFTLLYTFRMPLLLILRTQNVSSEAFLLWKCAKYWWNQKEGREQERHTHAQKERKRAMLSKCVWKYYNLKDVKRWNGVFCILVALYLITPPRESKNWKCVANGEGMYLSEWVREAETVRERETCKERKRKTTPWNDTYIERKKSERKRVTRMYVFS